jgi:hypothetical protein
VLFFAFALVRAVRLPLTYDEAASYMRYIDSTFPSEFDPNLLSVFNFEVATNHFLNTLLTKICWAVAGGSEVVLRVPNLAAYAMFLVCSLAILRRIRHPVVAFAGFLLLNLNPYVLDFFTLSRGYGLSLGFLMGAILFLLRCLERLPGDEASREAGRALACALGAALASFTLLNVYAALIVVLLVAFAILDARPDAAPAGRLLNTRALRRSQIWLFAAAAIFIGLVHSQDVWLSNSLYEPVVVELLGLEPAALDRARVVQVDIRGHERRLGRAAGAATWRSNPGANFRSLRVELPLTDAERLARLQVVIGNRPFSSDPRRSLWTSRDSGADRVFEAAPSLSLPKSRLATFRPLINWAGDPRYAARIVQYTALTLGILAACAVVLKLVGLFVVRSRILRIDRWRPIASSALWTTALVGLPLYLLKRNSALIFGGTRGLLQDTIYSAVESSFYGRIYHGDQTHIVFAGIVATCVVFCAVLFLEHRRGPVVSLRPALCLAGIMVVASVSVLAQRYLFGTLYLAGRTALFYIPLFVLFATFVCDAVTESGRAARAVALALVVSAVAFGTYHFGATANVTYTLDWRDDASTKVMIEDVTEIAARERLSGSSVALGLEANYAPVALYYTHRIATAIDVIVVPPIRGLDYLYVDERGGGIRPNAIRRYPITGTALVRVATMRLARGPVAVAGRIDENTRLARLLDSSIAR